jgi:hypothetical protein
MPPTSGKTQSVYIAGRRCRVASSAKRWGIANVRFVAERKTALALIADAASKAGSTSAGVLTSNDRFDAECGGRGLHARKR